MLENGVFNRPYVRDITKICECACSMNCDKNATELRPDRNPDIITNADRIRAMSDEELAWELMVWRCEAVSRHHGVESKYPDTQQTILKWLQQSTEEDT